MGRRMNTRKAARIVQLPHNTNRRRSKSNAAIMGGGGIAKTPLDITDADGNDSIAIRSIV
jgi:hypothetical protein